MASALLSMLTNRLVRANLAMTGEITLTGQAVLGIAAGLALALAATPQLAPLLYQVRPADPVSIVGAALFLIGVAVLASLIPAQRATRVDPIRALRQE